MKKKWLKLAIVIPIKSLLYVHISLEYSRIVMDIYALTIGKKNTKLKCWLNVTWINVSKLLNLGACYFFFNSINWFIYKFQKLECKD